MAAQKLTSVSIVLLTLTCLPLAQGLTSTTLALGVSANPSTYGAPVILTATVTPSNATGRITFYDDAVVLGSRALSSGGASLSTILLPTGTRKLTAYYSGDANYSGSTAGFTQTVKSVAAVGFRTAGSADIGSNTQMVVVGDFNGDGKADLAVSGNTNGGAVVTILLGKGDGTFPTPGGLHGGIQPHLHCDRGFQWRRQLRYCGQHLRQSKQRDCRHPAGQR